MKKNLFANKENLWNIIGILAGLAAIVIGIKFYYEYYYPIYTSSDLTFGADFYTEIYHTARMTLMSINFLRKFLVKGLCFIISFSGLITSILFARKITRNIYSVSISEKNSQNELMAETVSTENSLDISNDNPAEEQTNNSEEIICLLCGTKQNTTNTKCYKCGFPFKVD